MDLHDQLTKLLKTWQQRSQTQHLVQNNLQKITRHWHSKKLLSNLWGQRLPQCVQSSLQIFAHEEPASTASTPQRLFTNYGALAQRQRVPQTAPQLVKLVFSTICSQTLSEI